MLSHDIVTIQIHTSRWVNPCCHLVLPHFGLFAYCKGVKSGSVTTDITAASDINNGLIIQMLINRVAGGNLAHWEKHRGFLALNLWSLLYPIAIPVFTYVLTLVCHNQFVRHTVFVCLGKVKLNWAMVVLKRNWKLLGWSLLWLVKNTLNWW